MTKSVKYKIHLIDGTVIFVVDPKGQSMDKHKIDARNKFGDMFKRVEQL
jgi:hypothetical protein